ncbi:hydroxymethylglutaryl-CoA lyase [Dactylosporangium fulvum]|uniref:Hydroxymethylglutaryl-CoA lyase n=1 Tax=Dactylosporangium fulvum TaxID=53359 RepID=A0ABY5VSX6_9ACTN|nr:hydroxymethylglutaryl-CoA lyase [Dactylosporangium fulvum]UWP80259.1 hydroxymethylglutaryl-CoA lyase [Dactylosporangium fulvum]
MHWSDLRAVRLDVREVGLRDGLQIESPVPLEAKLRLVEAIVATGIRRVEVTSFVSPRAVPALADAAQLAEHLNRWPDIHWSALIANPRGAQRSIAAGIANVEYVISASDGHSIANAGKKTSEALAATSEVCEQIHEAGGTVEVIVATAWDCPFDGPTPPQRLIDIVAAAVGAGADAISLADTIGTVTPARLAAAVSDVGRLVRPDQIGLHLHDTRGSGQVNVLAGVLAGVRKFDASVGGLGGCPFAPGASGNIATEELAYWTQGSPIDSGIDVDRAVEAAAVAQDVVGHPLLGSLLRAGGRSRPRPRS